MYRPLRTSRTCNRIHSWM